VLVVNGGDGFRFFFFRSIRESMNLLPLISAAAASAASAFFISTFSLRYFASLAQKVGLFELRTLHLWTSILPA